MSLLNPSSMPYFVLTEIAEYHPELNTAAVFRLVRRSTARPIK